MLLNYEKLKGYRYIKSIGKGGQGEVIKISDPTGRRTYALKLLNKSSDLRLFEREIKTMQALNHSNIVSIYDAGFNDEEGGYILMEYMKHGNLTDYLLQNKEMSIKDRLVLIKDAAKALQYIHNEGFIHRDIKPQNIFITDDGNGIYASLGDFGIVKEIGQNTLTNTGAGVGTTIYLPLEVLDGNEKASKYTDLYALGMCLYEAISGELPYNTKTPLMFYSDIMNKEPLSLSEKNICIPKEIDKICLKNIARKKKERCQSIEEFIEDLEKSISLMDNQGESKEKKSKVVIDYVSPFELDSFNYPVINEYDNLNNNLNLYQKIELISDNGQRKVYKVKDKELNELYTMKQIRIEDQGDTTKREIKVLLTLRHPSLLPLYESWLENGHVYLITKYIEGDILKDKIRQKTDGLYEETYKTYLNQILDTITYIHSKKIIHRAISSKNILVTKDNKMIMHDLSSACFKDDKQRLYIEEEEGIIYGELRYMAPEACEKPSKATITRDIYSIGVVMYEMMTGKLPFCGENLSKILGKILSEDPIPPMQINRQIQKKMNDICLKALEKDPSKRYQSCEEFYQTLNECSN